MDDAELVRNSSSGACTKPAYISHYGIRAKQFKEMIQWYRTVFHAEIQHENEFLAFMTFDEEHHRIVIFEDPDTVDRPATAAGIDHIGYGVADFGDLVGVMNGLKLRALLPSRS